MQAKSLTVGARFKPFGKLARKPLKMRVDSVFSLHAHDVNPANGVRSGHTGLRAGVALEERLLRHPVFSWLPDIFELISLARVAGHPGLQPDQKPGRESRRASQGGTTAAGVLNYTEEYKQ